jgi:outer membrane protein assembly factor BamB
MANRKFVYPLIMVVCMFCSVRAFSQEWADWRGTDRKGLWDATGVVHKFTADTIPVKWSVPCGAGYNGPTVSGGKVYFMERVQQPEEQERVVCLDAGTGSRIWTFAYTCPYMSVGYPAGPRASVVIRDGKAYSLGTMGHLFCFNALTGKVLWKSDLNTEYQIRIPTWGIAATPLVIGDKIILQVGGSNGACILALHKDTGSEIWRALDDGAAYSAPVLIRQAGKAVVVVWTAESLAGLDAETGRVFWRIPHEVKLGMAISTPVLYENYLFVSSFYSGSLLVKISQTEVTAEKVWSRVGESERKTDALHCVINTPFIREGFIYGVDSYGELRCLRLDTGDRVWEDLTAVKKNRWANIHFIQHGTQTWMFNEHGELLITELSPKGLNIISRAKLIEPTTAQLNRSGVGVTWSHPAFAGRYIYVRSDNKLICADLSE